MSVKLNSEQTQSIEDSEIEDHFGDLPVEIIDETQNTVTIFVLKSFKTCPTAFKYFMTV